LQLKTYHIELGQSGVLEDREFERHNQRISIAHVREGSICDMAGLLSHVRLLLIADMDWRSIVRAVTLTLIEARMLGQVVVERSE
jgi:hypothetical protein